MKRALLKGHDGGKHLHRCIACGACDHRADTCASRAGKEIQMLLRRRSYLGISFSTRGRMGRQRTKTAMLMIPCTSIAVLPRTKQLGRSFSTHGHVGGHRKNRYAHDALYFTAVTHTKLFSNKFVDPWAYGKAPKKNRYAHHALNFHQSSCANLGLMGRSLD